MQEWQLIVAIIATVLTWAGLLFGIWKFIDSKIQSVRNDASERISQEERTRKEECQRLHDRVSEVKDSTPSHTDINRMEGYLERMTYRLDQMFAMFVDYNKKDNR